MKNKQGFTLIEVTIVVLILATIALITIPIVRTIINNSREKTYQINVTSIENAAKYYHQLNSAHINNLLETIEEVSVSVDQLKAEGLVDEDITNPKNNKLMSGYVRIKKISENNFEYKYFE